MRPLESTQKTSNQEIPSQVILSTNYDKLLDEFFQEKENILKAKLPENLYVRYKHHQAFHSVSAHMSESTPPDRADKLLTCVLTPDRLDEVLGDFDEGYRRIV